MKENEEEEENGEAKMAKERSEVMAKSERK